MHLRGTVVALKRFLRDPEQRVGRFPIRKERRQHLHQQIDTHRCDLTHVTEPQVDRRKPFVCTKTQGSCMSGGNNNLPWITKLLAELKAAGVAESDDAAGQAIFQAGNR